MEWLSSIRTTIDYMEEHLTDDISAQDVADRVYLSPFFLQRGFSLMTGCGMMQNSASSNQRSTASAQTSTATSQQPVFNTTNGVTAGQNAGTALQGLYAQYKADGKYDYTNLQNIMNTVTLIGNCEGLKNNYKEQGYVSDFGKGLLIGSLGLVTQNNVQTVTNSLYEMVKDSEPIQESKTQIQSGLNTAATYANTAAQYAGAVGSLLSLFGGQQ